MTAITPNVTLAGTPDADDRLAFRLVVDEENARRAAVLPPIAALPASTPAEYRSSAVIVYTQIMQSAHASYVTQGVDKVTNSAEFRELRPYYAKATPAQQAAARSALGMP